MKCRSIVSSVGYLLGEILIAASRLLNQKCWGTGERRLWLLKFLSLIKVMGVNFNEHCFQWNHNHDQKPINVYLNISWNRRPVYDARVIDNHLENVTKKSPVPSGGLGK